MFLYQIEYFCFFNCNFFSEIFKHYFVKKHYDYFISIASFLIYFSENAILLIFIIIG